LASRFRSTSTRRATLAARGFASAPVYSFCVYILRSSSNTERERLQYF
jgi:hypothetical protein